MTQVKKVPAIRFKGFSENWEEDRFGNRLDIENGYAFKSIYFQDEPNRLIVLTPGNVHIGGGFQKDKGRYYSEAGEIPSRFILKPDDIFVTMTDLTPTAQTLGYPAVVPNDENTYLLNQRLGKIANFELDKIFLVQILSTEKYHKQIVSSATGTTVKHSSPQKILSVVNHFPSIIEQTQIGSYYQHLDKLISLHQNKVNKLTNLKKAMLEKMFPKHGANVPEIRFKGFAEAWVEKTISNIALVKTGLPFDSNEFSDDGEFLVITNGNIQNESPYVDNTIGNRINITNEAVIKEYVLNIDDILITMDGTVGRAARVVNDKLVLAQRVGRLIANSSSKFLYYLLNAGSFYKSMTLLASGGTIKHISLNDIACHPIKIPKLAKEEKMIGEYFHSLDKVITLHQTELEKLNNLKKACLENMFV